MDQCESACNLYDISTADVFFLCTDDDTKVVPAHKCMLASNSTKFRDFFAKNDVNQILPENCKIDTMSIFLRSFYCPSFSIDRKNIVELTHLSEKYDALKCKSSCWKFLNLMIQKAYEDIFDVLDLSIIYGNVQLRGICQNKVMAVGRYLIETESFIRCSYQVLEAIIVLAFLKRNEVNVFKACIKWAKYHCNQMKLEPNNPRNIRLMLGDCFKIIQFDKMTAEQFIRCQSLHADLFAADELMSISKKIIQKVPQIIEPNVQHNLLRQFIQSSVNANDAIFTMIEKMLGDSVTANVFFVFDSNKKQKKWIYAHKCILSVKSPVFKKLFFGEYSADNNNYPVSDATYDEFHAFIQTFYYNTADNLLSIDNIFKMNVLAKLYEVTTLQTECINFAIKNLCFQHIFRILDLCFVYSNADSVSVCLDWIIHNEHEMNLAFHPQSLIHCTYKTVEFALGLTFPDRNENDLFKASIEWAKNVCKQKKVQPTEGNIKMALGQAHHLIQQNKLTIEEMEFANE